MPIRVNKSIHEVLKEITRTHGEDVVVLGSQMKGRTIGRMTTGVLSYDAILGGGWPMGSWSEVIGNESHGKTLLAQSTVIANQEADAKHTTLWIAGEPVNFEWCETLGMDLSRVQFVPGNNMEQAYDIALRFMENRLVDLVVIDSLPSLIPTSEDDREFDELTIGKAAMINNKFFVRKATTAMKRSYTHKDRPCTGIAINQWRDRVGVTHGDPRIAPGGLGKNFAFYVRVDMTRTEWLKDGTKVVGGRFRMRTIKNKVAPVNRAAEINFYFDAVPGHDKGSFDHVEDIVAAGLYYDVFGAGGAGYYAFGEGKWRGKERLLAAVRENFGLQDEIRAAVMHVINPDADRRKVRIVTKR